MIEPVDTAYDRAMRDQRRKSEKHSAHLAALLDATREQIRSYVVLSSAQADACTLWAAHSHVVDAFEATPYLAVTSPEKRCGKTRLLDVLELLVAKPWRAIMPSDAVLFRKIAAVGPTLLLDETDAIFNAKNANTEPLRALLNAGNRRGTTVPRCVGPSMQLVDFAVFCPKALTGIGALPGTIADRAIPIRLARKRPDEHALRFRRREALETTEPIAQALASWGQDALSSLELARPEVPDALDDRAEEAWEPLIAIADLAGGSWPERARIAAVHLSASEEHEDQALGGKLLADVQAVFETSGSDRMSSASLAATLSELEESPWGDLWGKTLDARGLARRLKPYGVRPRSVRLDDGSTPKGYLLEQFEDAFARYLGTFDRHTATNRTDTGFAADSEAPHVADVADEKRPKSAWLSHCVGVADKSAQNGRGHLDDGLPSTLSSDEQDPQPELEPTPDHDEEPERDEDDVNWLPAETAA